MNLNCTDPPHPLYLLHGQGRRYRQLLPDPLICDLHHYYHPDYHQYAKSTALPQADIDHISSVADSLSKNIHPNQTNFQVLEACK